MGTIDPRSNPTGRGLKRLRNHPLRQPAPIDPNVYHKREARERCGCGRKKRTPQHRCA